jgi:hypothetical protein
VIVAFAPGAYDQKLFSKGMGSSLCVSQFISSHAARERRACANVCDRATLNGLCTEPDVIEKRLGC